MKGLDELIVVAWMLFGIYMLVLFSVAADFWSGTRKAKKRGEMRSSYGFKRTIDKIARYFNALLALTVVDCMQMGSIWYLDSYYGYHAPIIPVITIIGAIGIGCIEIKSIYEKAEDKVKFKSVGNLAGRIIQNKDDLLSISKAIVDYMKETKEGENK